MLILMNDKPLPALKSHKGWALLCYLAVTGKVHTRSALAGLLWSDSTETKARANLRKVLSQLKGQLPTHLLIDRRTISFNQESYYWLDVAKFEAGISQKSDFAQLQEAVALYQGDFLDGFYLPGATLFDEWMLTKRVQLRELALKALRSLAAHNTGHGEVGWGAAIDYLTQLLKIEPWHEEAHRELMRLLALSGQRSAALMQFERCRQILLDELGVEPGVETTDLYERIRGGNFIPSHDKIETTTMDREIIGDQQLIGEKILFVSQFSSNLPLQATNFVGRERELVELEDQIFKRGIHLVTLVGPGGIGKTRLALEFAERQLPPSNLISQIEGHPSHPFPNGIFFVPLESLESNESIFPAIAEAMRFRMDRGKVQLMDYLSTKKMLLIIDNFEHLLSSSEILTEIMRSAPGVHILVTSRERLRLHEEQVYPLQGLEFPEITLAGRSIDYSAGLLFLQAARRQQPDFTLEPSDHENLARICALVEGMPLALELAASWTDTLPLSNIVAEIQRNFDFLEAEFRNIPSRHRSIRAVIDGSWEQLLPEEKDVFSQLSVFRGGFTREAATTVTGATVKILSNLLGKSLLRYSKSRDRYFIHELLRQYAADKLVGPNKLLEKLNEKHSQYYCKWFENQISGSTMKSEGQKAVLDAMTAELENTRAAWKWSLENNRLEYLKLRTSAIGMYYVWRGGFREGARTFQSFADLLTDLDGKADARRVLYRISTLNWQSFFLSELGDRTKAIELLVESQTLLNSPRVAEVDTRVQLAQNLVTRTRTEWSQSVNIRLDNLAQARALYREVGHPFGLPYALTTSARLAMVAGRMEEARQFLEESLELYESIGNQLGQSVSLTGLANLVFAENDYAKAGRLLHQSIEIAEEMEDFERITIASLSQGTVLLYAGHFHKAQVVLDKCVANFADLGLRPRHATALYYLGYDLTHLGKYDQAVEYGQTAIRLGEQSNKDEIFSQSMLLSAAAALATSDFTKALSGFEEAAKYQDSRQLANVVHGEDCGQVGLGVSLLLLGREDEAENIFTSLLQQAVANHRQDKLLYALVGIAILLAKQGDAERATELYSLAASYPFVGNSYWFTDAFGQHIEAAGKKLSSTRIEAIKIQGEHRDLWGIADELILEYAIA